MIFGIGTDILDIRRIEACYQRHGKRLINRIIPSEDRHTIVHPRMLAKAFSAKEAFSKAVGIGCRYPIKMSWISIYHEPSGKPYFYFHGPLASYMSALNVVVHLSISDSNSYVVCYVVIEKY